MCSIMINLSVGGEAEDSPGNNLTNTPNTKLSPYSGRVTRVTTGQFCRVIIGVTTAVLLLPYMVLRHGFLHVDSSLVRTFALNNQNNTGATQQATLSVRHLQALTSMHRGLRLHPGGRSSNYSRTSHSGQPVGHLVGANGTNSKVGAAHSNSNYNRMLTTSAGTLPPSVRKALNYSNRTGYLTGNISSLAFQEYYGQQEVELRLIVLAYNRGYSLLKCLRSLNSAYLENTTVSLHVWIDRDNETGEVDTHTYHVANTFIFSHGAYQVHVQPEHVGILNQWVNVWRPGKDTREIALILEDDMTVSKYFWRWLRPVQSAYSNESDISGYGLSHPGMEHMHATYLDIPTRFTVYKYKVICTWGFSPHPTSWRQFQDWFYRTETNSTFLPLVPEILPTQWFLGELRHGQERNLWEMWHICFSHYHKPPQYTIMLNTAQEGLLAVNRHEAGLHDKGNAKSTDPLCAVWREEYEALPKVLPRFGYDGKLENGEEVKEVGFGESYDGMDTDAEGYPVVDISDWTGR